MGSLEAFQRACHSNLSQSQDSVASTELGDPVHSDVMSAGKQASFWGSKYYITLLGDASGVSMVQFVEKIGST